MNRNRSKFSPGLKKRLVMVVSLLTCGICLGGILEDHEGLYAYHGRVSSVRQNGDVIVDIGSATGIVVNMAGAVVRTKPRALFVAKVEVKNVFPEDAVLRNTAGTLAIQEDDHVFLGEVNAILREDPDVPGTDEPTASDILETLIDMPEERPERTRGQTARETARHRRTSGEEMVSVGRARWPKIVNYRKIYTSPVRSLALQPLWSYDGARILVQTSSNSKTKQHWIRVADGLQLEAPVDKIGWDASFSRSSELNVSCLRTGNATGTNYTLRLSDKNGEKVQDYDVGENSIAHPVLSRDGRTIAFQQAKVDRQGTSKDWRIKLLDVETGDVKAIPAKGLEDCTSPCWFSDDKELLCYLDPVRKGESGGIGKLNLKDGSWAVLARKSLRSGGWPLTFGPTEECCLSLEFLIEKRPDGQPRVIIDAVAVNLERQKSRLLELARYPRIREPGSALKNHFVGTPYDLQLSADGKQLLCELRKETPAGQKGYYAELWVADIEWQAHVPTDARYVGMDAVRFRDSFDNNQANWSTHDSTNGHTVIRNGRYELLQKNPRSFLFGNTGLKYRDVDCSVIARRLAGPEDNQFGIIFRMKDNDNFYKFAVSSDRYFCLQKWVDGDEESILKWKKSSAIKGDIDTLRVHCVGRTISLYANDVLLKEVTDQSHSLGKIALFAGTIGDKTDVSIAFDDFSATPLGDRKGVYSVPAESLPFQRSAEPSLEDTISIGARVEAVRNFQRVRKGWRGTYYGLHRATPPVCVAWDKLRGQENLGTPAVPDWKKERVFNVEWNHIKAVE